MDEKYYQIIPRSNPDVYGIVVKSHNGKLECLTGGLDEINEFGCNLDTEGNFFVGGGYFHISISKLEAKILQKNYDSWNLQRGWIASDSTPQFVLSNTPGTPEYAGRN